MNLILKSCKENFLGMALCVAMAIPSWFLGGWFPVVGGPVFAILFGIILGHFIKNREKLNDGILFTSKKILQYAVILLGFGMNLGDILSKGKESLPIIITTITVALCVGFFIFKMLKVESKVATLITVGSSICGGSAIAATAPVIGAKNEDIAQSISVVFLFNVVAALTFPALGSLLGMSNEGFGLFAGTAINDTSSVTAAATAWDGIFGSSILEEAATVKLTRTLVIIPVTLVLAIYSARKEKRGGSTFNLKKVFPIFIIFFLLAATITTFFSLNLEVILVAKNLSKFFIIMAMVAIGLNTNIIRLIKSGGKPVLMGLSCWISIMTVSLGMQYFLDLW